MRGSSSPESTGKAYVVRDILPDPFDSGYFGITLVGINNPSDWFGVKNGFVWKEFCFPSFRFRPIDPKDAERWDSYRIDIYDPAPVSRN